ncbi:MAG TPA: hypothetical protein VIV12_27605 [Streptosporangiaceae bacterium]
MLALRWVPAEVNHAGRRRPTGTGVEAAVADNDPDDLNALADEQVTELFGWPVRLLDQLMELHHLGDRGEIRIDEWRRRDALLRAAGPGQSPREQMEAIREAALEVWVDAPADDEETRKKMFLLAERLGAALHGAPSDQVLRGQPAAGADVGWLAWNTTTCLIPRRPSSKAF